MPTENPGALNKFERAYIANNLMRCTAVTFLRDDVYPTGKDSGNSCECQQEGYLAYEKLIPSTYSVRVLPAVSGGTTGDGSSGRVRTSRPNTRQIG